MKHLSSIFTVLTVLGTGLTGWAAYKFGRKCEREGVDFHDLNTLKTVAPDLSKPVGIAVTTAGFAIGAQTVNMKAIATTAAAATGALAWARRLEDEARATVGDTKFEEMKKNIGKKIAENTPFAKQPELPNAKLGDGKETYILEWGKPVKFRATRAEILEAELGINKLMHEKGEASFADYMDLLPNLEPTKEDIAMGWTLESTIKLTGPEFGCASMIDFHYVKIKLDSGDDGYMICVNKKQLTFLYDMETGLKLN